MDKSSSGLKARSQRITRHLLKCFPQYDRLRLKAVSKSKQKSTGASGGFLHEIFSLQKMPDTNSDKPHVLTAY